MCVSSKSTNTRVHVDLKKIIRKESEFMGVSEVAASKSLAEELSGIRQKRERLWEFKI